jgi:hypothetical protein
VDLFTHEKFPQFSAWSSVNGTHVVNAKVILSIHPLSNIHVNQIPSFSWNVGYIETLGVCCHEVASIIIGAAPTPETKGIIAATATIAREFGRIPEI